MNAFVSPPSPGTRPASVPFVPETAPFTPAQRAWLNGFFAGLFSGAPATAPTSTPAPAPVETEEFPWHDPSLELADRLRLAEGRPLARRLMAAMAQLDCGQCGYVCRTYAEALAGVAARSEEAAALRALADGEEGAEPAAADLLDLLETFPSARPPLQAPIDSLPRLEPRLYSIASSQLAVGEKVELCIGVVRESRRGRIRDGVASCHLAFRAFGGKPLPAEVVPSHFRLPADPSTPVVMIGRGTGIAPFRAFLQHRGALGITGRTWLFFGNPNRATDFLFAEEIEGWRKTGILERLSLAWSRDGTSKTYVQHGMREEAVELWRWLEDGANLYVCGDASRMAKDVDAALREIAQVRGGRSEEGARDWLATLAPRGRYLRDVY